MWTRAAKVRGLTISEWIRRSCNLQAGAFGATAGPKPEEKEYAAPVIRESVKRSRFSRTVRGIDRTEQPVKKQKGCKHGTKTGYHCWQCGGVAKTESGRDE
jgi:hypothetical protein